MLRDGREVPSEEGLVRLRWAGEEVQIEEPWRLPPGGGCAVRLEATAEGRVWVQLLPDAEEGRPDPLDPFSAALPPFPRGWGPGRFGVPPGADPGPLPAGEYRLVVLESSLLRAREQPEVARLEIADIELRLLPAPSAS